MIEEHIHEKNIGTPIDIGIIGADHVGCTALERILIEKDRNLIIVGDNSADSGDTWGTIKNIKIESDFKIEKLTPSLPFTPPLTRAERRKLKKK